MLADHGSAVAAAYGLGRPTGELVLSARGEQGRVWRLDTDRGSFAVKDLIERQLPADVALDVAFQDAVLSTGSVAMPRPIRTLAGEVLVDIAGHQLRVYEWVGLLPVDRGLDAGLVGATLAAVHRVRYWPARRLSGWYSDPVGVDRWRELLEAADAVHAPFVESFRAEIPHLVGLEALIERPRNVQNCHRDLWADNLLPGAHGGVCVIDWENCGLEDPAHEIPMVLFDFGSGDEKRTGELYSAYVEAGGPGRLRGRGCFTMVIAQFGHFWEQEVSRYVAAEASADVRDHSIGRIDEALRTPLRIEHIDAVLDWVAASGVQ